MKEERKVGKLGLEKNLKKSGDKEINEQTNQAKES